MPRVLILSTTTGYQLRSFGDAAAARRDRADLRDRSLPSARRSVARRARSPVRFHEEDASVAAIVASRARAADRRRARGRRSAGRARGARRAARWACRAIRPTPAAASANKKLARERFAAAGLPVPWFIERRRRGRRRDDPRDRVPCVVKPLGLSGSRGVIRADYAARSSTPRSRACARCSSRKDVRAARTRARGHASSSRASSRARVRDRRGPHRRHAARVRDLRQARSARRPVLRGDDLRHAVVVGGRANRRRCSSRCSARASALGLTRRAAPRRVPRRPRRRVHAGSGGAADRRTCAREVLRFHGPRASAIVSLEEVLLRHAVGARHQNGMTASRRPPRVMMIPIPKRGILKRVDGMDAAARRAGHRGGHDHREDGSAARAAAGGGQLPGVHVRARAAIPQTWSQALKQRTCQRFAFRIDTPHRDRGDAVMSAAYLAC